MTLATASGRHNNPPNTPPDDGDAHVTKTELEELKRLPEDVLQRTAELENLILEYERLTVLFPSTDLCRRVDD